MAKIQVNCDVGEYPSVSGACDQKGDDKTQSTTSRCGLGMGTSLVRNIQEMGTQRFFDQVDY
jgi:hypothetical protein